MVAMVADVDYVSDAKGRRVERRVDGLRTAAWLWRGQLAPAAELDESGAVARRYVYSDGVNVPDLVIDVATGARWRLIKDHLGSVRRVVDVATGVVVRSVDFDSFGRVLAESGDEGAVPFGFAGGLADAETGLVRFGAREYGAETGRWVAKDPIRFDGGDANIYAYVGNDPVNLGDPTGRNAAAALLGIYGSCLLASYVAAEIAFPDWSDDKKRHCYASCMVSRCSLSMDPVADGIGHAWEHASNLTTSLDDDSLDDIDANRHGIEQSHNFREDCRDLCDEYDHDEPEPWCE